MRALEPKTLHAAAVGCSPVPSAQGSQGSTGQSSAEPGDGDGSQGQMHSVRQKRGRWLYFYFCVLQ